MPLTLAPDTVLAPAGRCVIREQEQQFLIYHNGTDELHLISPTGCYVYRLCDGLRTVGELQQQLGAGAEDASGTLDVRLGRFLVDLVARDVLRVVATDD